MSYWEENKDGGLGIAVILAKDMTPAGFAHEDAPGGKGNANNLLLVKVNPRFPCATTRARVGRRADSSRTARAGKNTFEKIAMRMQHPLKIDVSAKP